MSVSEAQATVFVNAFGGTGAGISLGSNNTAGNILVLVMAYAFNPGEGTGGGLASVGDTLGNTGWPILAGTLARNTSGSHYSEIGVQIAICNSIKAGANTVTPVLKASSTSNNPSVTLQQLYELTGQDTSTQPDQSAETTTTGTNPTVTSVTTVRNGEFGICCAIGDSGGPGGNYTAGSGWTGDTLNQGGNNNYGFESIAQATAGALSGNFGWVNSNPYAISIVTIQPPSALMGHFQLESGVGNIALETTGDFALE